PLGAGLLLSEIVVRRLLSQTESLVALLHQRDDLVRRQLVALPLGQRGRVHAAVGRRDAQDRRGSRDTRGPQEAAPAREIVPECPRRVCPHATALPWCPC